jgi:hypothetical protein
MKYFFAIENWHKYFGCIPLAATHVTDIETSFVTVPMHDSSHSQEER